MKWLKFKIKTITDAEDIIISTLYDLVWKEHRLKIRFL